MRWLLVDRLEECEPGKRVVAVKTFSRSDFFLMDPFPGKEMVARVLEIEMIAQTAGICIRLLRPKTLSVLSSVRIAHFIKPICPGETCRITAEIVKMRPHCVRATGYIEVEGVRVGEAEFEVSVVPSSEFNATDALIEDWTKQQGGYCEPDSLETSDAAFAF